MYSVKKIAVFLTPIAILAVIIGCSKDNEAPMKSTYAGLPIPSTVIADYDSINDRVDLSWTLADTDTAGVVGYFISASDSSDFAKGDLETFKVGYGIKTFSYEASILIASDEKETVRYFSVAVILKSVKYDYFIGPESEVVMETILR